MTVKKKLAIGFLARSVGKQFFRVLYDLKKMI